MQNLFKQAKKPLILRPYQSDAIDAVYNHLRTRDDNPVIVLPTASGKTPLIATLCRDAVVKWGGRVLVLAHVKELLEQTAETLRDMCGDIEVGVFSAGLNSRDTHQPIIVAGIQSVYQKAFELDRFDMVLVDEAHLIPMDGEGMYRQFLSDAHVVNPNLRVIGLTATPYRLKGGLIAQADHFLNTICYEISVKKLIADGYLCPLKSKAGKSKANFDNLHLRGGEFIPSEIEAAMDNYTLVESACREIVELTQNRNKVLIFASGVEHGKHVAGNIKRLGGQECGFICGDTPGLERESLIERFKHGDLKFLANVNVLTTGFNATNIDCVVLLRPTNSPGLYYQMVGRGFRLHPGKEDCLVLDYGGNIMRHGPVDDLQIKQPGKSNGEAPAKECQKCQSVVHAAISTCPDCGYEFPPPEREKHQSSATNAGILSGQVTDEVFEVKDVMYHIHRKKGADVDTPRTLRVEYETPGYVWKKEWVCPEHTGYARGKFEAWWRKRSNEPQPDTIEQAIELAEAGVLAEPVSITVRTVSGEKFDRIIGYELGPIPPRLDGSDERECEGPLSIIDDDEIPF